LKPLPNNNKNNNKNNKKGVYWQKLQTYLELNAQNFRQALNTALNLRSLQTIATGITCVLLDLFRVGVFFLETPLQG